MCAYAVCENVTLHKCDFAVMCVGTPVDDRDRAKSNSVHT